MSQTTSLAFLSLLAGAYAQQVGTSQAEVHPPLTVSTCTAAGVCTSQTQSIVLDANWRWVHNVGGYTNCYTGNTWDATLCPNDATCAANCALDGADYSGTYGITTSGDALTLDFVTGTNVGSRTYLLDTTGTKYEEFKLLNQEFTFDVDVSTLPCGLNGALYFVSMDADGGEAKYPTNKAGAAYGTGYCDSQCPQDLKFIDGLANVQGWTPSTGDANSGTGTMGSCCDELDVWEANDISTAFTPHPCTSTGQTMCNTTVTCGAGSDRADGYCDKDGCDFNAYRLGNTSFYGPGKTIDTTKVFTVVTQFITADGTATGELSQIKRFYVQDGTIYANAETDIAGITTTNAISETFCDQEKAAFGDATTFEAKGGLAKMGTAMANGMVLVMSIWDDYAAQMLWLDAAYPVGASTTTPGVVRGTCGANSGVPATVEAAGSGVHVVYSNIKTGPIGSTF